MAYYLAKKGTTIHETSTSKVSLLSAKLKAKSKIQADLSRYITKAQQTLWNKMIKKRNKIPDFSREDVAAIF
jgi:hypothetical protein